MMKPLRVEMQPWCKALAWACIAFFSLCAVGSGLAEVWLATFGFLAFVGLGSMLLLLLGPIEADAQGIWQTTRAGRYEIKWSEVTGVETAANTDFVLHAPGKRLALPGPALWREQGRAEMAEYIESQLKAWNIPSQQTARAAFQMSKNTKVPRPSRRPPLSP